MSLTHPSFKLLHFQVACAAMGHVHGPKIPSYTTYDNWRDIPKLKAHEERLARIGLKDPWIRYFCTPIHLRPLFFRFAKMRYWETPRVAEWSLGGLFLTHYTTFLGLLPHILVTRSIVGVALPFSFKVCRPPPPNRICNDVKTSRLKHIWVSTFDLFKHFNRFGCQRQRSPLDSAFIVCHYLRVCG